MNLDEKLAAVPWRSLGDAYGSARDFPQRIREIWTRDGDVRCNVIYDFLFSRATHQYTLYTATPFVIPFVIEALWDDELRSRDREYDPSIVVALLGFLQTCANSGERAINGSMHPNSPRISAAIAGGAKVYELLSTDEDREIARLADLLKVYCDTLDKRA